MTTTFHGIDFANRKANHGRCWLVDDGTTLTASFSEPDAVVVRTAIDCPFGTTVAFERLLRGETATNAPIDVFKSRATERLMREVVPNYAINRDWLARPVADRESFPRSSFFNGGAHVQPTVGMVIVPELLAWLGARADLNSIARLDAFRHARLGDGTVVEAHPRLFMYSAFERLRRSREKAFDARDMDAVAGYKGNDADAEARRLRVYDLLTSDTTWLGRERRGFAIADVALLVATDHAFDAWLSALTAWAHQHCETWTWRDTERLDEGTVVVEGHILILRAN